MITSVKERQRALLEGVESQAGVGETARFALPLLARARCAENNALATACARFCEHCAQLRVGVETEENGGAQGAEQEEIDVLNHVNDLQVHELQFCLLNQVRVSENLGSGKGLLDAALLVANDDLRLGFAKALRVLPKKLRVAELCRWGGLEDWFVAFREAGETEACVSAYFEAITESSANLRVQDYQFAQKACGAALLTKLARNGDRGDLDSCNPALIALEYLALVASAQFAPEVPTDHEIRLGLIQKLLSGVVEQLPNVFHQCKWPTAL